MGLSPTGKHLLNHSARTLQPFSQRGKSAGYRNAWWLIVAGFVDPSESLEETVTREVYEESGIQVTNVT